MKFRLIEDILFEEQKHYRGETSLRQFVCSLLHTFLGGNFNYNDYIIHHKDGDHSNNNIENIILLQRKDIDNPNLQRNYNTSLHNLQRRDRIVFDPNEDEEKYKEYLRYLEKFRGIDILQTIKNKRLSNSNGDLIEKYIRSK